MTAWPGISLATFTTDGSKAVPGPDVAAAALRWSRALADAGVAEGEPVGLWAPNSLDLITAILAVRSRKAAAVPFHARWTADEVRRAARTLGCRVVLCAGQPSTAVEGAATLPAWNRALELRSLAGRPSSVDGDYVIHTSGTEGSPKAVLLSHEGMRRHAEASAERLGATPDDRWLATLSLAHVGGLAMLVRAVHAGHALILPPPVMPADLGSLVRPHRVTHMSLVPTQLERWLRAAPGGGPPPTLNVILVGGAAAPQHLLDEASARGWPIRLTYGLTEAASQVATADPRTPPGSVGRPLPGAEVRLVDDEGGDVPVAVPGRVLVRAPWCMRGYHGDAASTAARLADGWLVTDDLAHRDESGNLWMVGRLGDRIVTGGEKVDPGEVENVLGAHPAVAEACVVGVPDPQWGERVTAVVVLHPQAQLAPGGLRAFAATRLASYKCPRQEIVVPALPRTASGKVARGQVRQFVAGATSG